MLSNEKSKQKEVMGQVFAKEALALAQTARQLLLETDKQLEEIKNIKSINIKSELVGPYFSTKKGAFSNLSIEEYKLLLLHAIREQKIDAVNFALNKIYQAKNTVPEHLQEKFSLSNALILPPEIRHFNQFKALNFGEFKATIISLCQGLNQEIIKKQAFFKVFYASITEQFPQKGIQNEKAFRKIRRKAINSAKLALDTFNDQDGMRKLENPIVKEWVKELLAQNKACDFSQCDQETLYARAKASLVNLDNKYNAFKEIIANILFVAINRYDIQPDGLFNRLCLLPFAPQFELEKGIDWVVAGQARKARDVKADLGKKESFSLAEKAMKSDIGVLIKLVQNGLDAKNLPIKEKFYTLCKRGKTQAVGALLRHADVLGLNVENALKGSYDTFIPLHLALAQENYQMAMLLIIWGTDLHQVNEVGQNALHHLNAKTVATKQQRRAFRNFLTQCGVNADLEDIYGKKPRTNYGRNPSETSESKIVGLLHAKRNRRQVRDAITDRDIILNQLNILLEKPAFAAYKGEIDNWKAQYEQAARANAQLKVQNNAIISHVEAALPQKAPIVEYQREAKGNQNKRSSHGKKKSSCSDKVKEVFEAAYNSQKKRQQHKKTQSALSELFSVGSLTRAMDSVIKKIRKEVLSQHGDKVPKKHQSGQFNIAQNCEAFFTPLEQKPIIFSSFNGCGKIKITNQEDYLKNHQPKLKA